MPKQGPADRLANLQKRARIVQTIRAFFIERDFLEVETPHRIPTNAPEAHIQPYASEDWQLHTSPELAMKRLLSAGAKRLFQICRCWRQEERGRRHLSEFTLLEWYRTGTDYHSLMTDCESLLQVLVPSKVVSYSNQQIDLSRPWPRITVAEAFSRHTDTSVAKALNDDRFDEIYTVEIEPKLGLTRPTFLTEFPTPLAALARKKPGHPEVAERFELYIAGIELANAFSELTDPLEQRQRFREEQQQITDNGRQTPVLPEAFLSDLAQMPESAGIALGIDRLIMLLLDTEQIDDVVAFTPEEL